MQRRTLLALMGLAPVAVPAALARTAERSVLGIAGEALSAPPLMSGFSAHTAIVVEGYPGADSAALLELINAERGRLSALGITTQSLVEAAGEETEMPDPLMGSIRRADDDPRAPIFDAIRDKLQLKAAAASKVHALPDLFKWQPIATFEDHYVEASEAGEHFGEVLLYSLCDGYHLAYLPDHLSRTLTDIELGSYSYWCLPPKPPLDGS